MSTLTLGEHCEMTFLLERKGDNRNGVSIVIGCDSHYGTHTSCFCVSYVCVHALQYEHSADHRPRYNTEYGTLAECQSACVDEVPRCNTLNYAPAEVADKYV